MKEPSPSPTTMHPDQTTPDDHHTEDSTSDGQKAPDLPEISQDAEAETTRAAENPAGDAPAGD